MRKTKETDRILRYEHEVGPETPTGVVLFSWMPPRPLRLRVNTRFGCGTFTKRQSLHISNWLDRTRKLHGSRKGRTHDE